MKKSFADRFWYRVRITPGCWEWVGSKTQTGYGIYGQKPLVTAHRAAYTNLVAEIPTELCVLHKCDNPLCVNPDHLFLGTKIDNNKDRHAKGRTSHDSRNLGSSHGLSVINDDIARQIIYLRRYKIPINDVAAIFGISRSLVSAVAVGKRWSHATGVER